MEPEEKEDVTSGYRVGRASLLYAIDVKSSSGVQQGELLPRQELDLTFQHWYLEDGVLCGPVTEVPRSYLS